MSHPLRGVLLRDIPAARRALLGRPPDYSLLAVYGRQPPVSNNLGIGARRRDFRCEIREA